MKLEKKLYGLNAKFLKISFEFSTFQNESSHHVFIVQ